MDFHHREPTNKTFDISQHNHRMWHKIATELQKCDILCANCHRMIEEENNE